MSTIEKLIISGIRSFGSNDETIEFQRPLTLLVGPNGAGKTTIIECLKFGITGGKPCDYKYFNNPKVVREEFPSKVKLQIRNQIGKQIEIERNTWFKNKIAKSKATINWEGKSISPKSKDAKDLLAELIDVSEPILNYIVFCHQENSNWPINTGNKLKTTFDSIFNLDRYNEALKNIRSKQQEYKTQAANVETDIKNLEEKRNEAHKCRKELEDTKEKVKNVVGDIHKNQIELDDVEKELSDLTEQKKKVQSLDNEIENLINKKEAKVETCKCLDSRITKIDNVSDENLHKMHSEIVSKVKKLSVWKKDLIAEEEKQKPISTTITKLRTELDLLLKQERENVYSRDQKIRNYAEKSKIQLSDAALSEDEIVRFREEFEANTAMQVEKLRKQKDKDAKDLENAQEDFRQKDEAKMKLQVKSDDMRRRLEELVQKQDQVKQRLLENKSIQETTNWDETCNKLAEAQKELDEEKFKTKLSLLNGDLEELKVKRKLHKFNVDLTDSALKEALKSTLARSKLQLLQEQLKEKEDLMKILKEDGKQLLTSETETNFLSMSYSDLMNRKREIDKKTENISSKLAQIGDHKEHKTYFLEQLLCLYKEEKMVDAFIVHKKDIESFRRKKEILKKDLPDSNLSVEDILNKRNDCINTLDLLEQEIDGKHDEILQTTKNILDRKSKVIVMLESKLTLLSAAKENEWLNDQQRNLNKDILSVETQLEQNKKQLFELIKEENGLNETRHILENKRGKINPDLEIQKLESIQKLLFDDLQKADEAASKFHEEKMSLEKLIKINEQQLKKSSSTIKTLDKEIQSYKDDIDKFNERNIDDNLRLRKVNREIEEIEDQLKNKQQKRLEEINGAQLSKDIAIKEAQKQALSIELAKASTTKEHLRCDITKLKMDLQNEKYRDVEKKYVESIIKSKTYSKASDELVDYHNALDNAIVKYHEIKMEKINQTAKELWQETYSGKDIDCIKITSERKRENKSTVHSYDYGVKMVSDDDEKEVKECCSAGQKVLASLVIRLAIAQHCCKNFNVLALDEPTTNLDRNNIENLAISLNKLVSMRSGQINFQLLVITHNETFVELLGNSGSVERYFRVRKKKSYSCIKTEPISHIFDHDDDSDDEKGEDAMML